MSCNAGLNGAINDHLDLIVLLSGLLHQAHPELLNFARQNPPTPINGGFGTMPVHPGDSLVGIAWYITCYIGYLYRNNHGAHQAMQIRAGIRHLLMLMLAYVAFCCYETCSPHAMPPQPPTFGPSFGAIMNGVGSGFPLQPGYQHNIMTATFLPVGVAATPVPVNSGIAGCWGPSPWAVPHFAPTAPPASMMRPIFPGPQPPMFRAPFNLPNGNNPLQPQGRPFFRSSQPPLNFGPMPQPRGPIHVHFIPPSAPSSAPASLPSSASASPGIQQGQGDRTRNIPSPDSDSEFLAGAMASLNLSTSQPPIAMPRNLGAAATNNQAGNNTAASNLTAQQQAPGNRSGPQQAPQQRLPHLPPCYHPHSCYYH